MSIPSTTRGAHTLPPCAQLQRTSTCPDSRWDPPSPARSHESPGSGEWLGGRGGPLGTGQRWAALPPLRRGRRGTPRPPPSDRPRRPPNHRRRGGALPFAQGWGTRQAHPPLRSRVQRGKVVAATTAPQSPSRLLPRLTRGGGEPALGAPASAPARPTDTRPGGRAAGPRGAGGGRRPRSIPLTGRPAAGPNRF